MLTSATKRKIDNARDILVGKIPMPTTQVEQITLALIYKFMSDIDKKSKALGDTSGFFANGYEKYAWDNLMDKSLPARDRVTLYSEGLEKMSKNPHIPQLFRDIFKNAFLPFRSPETLKLFLEQIDEFQYDHSEELGNAFEYLLSVMGSQGDAGQFRTPRHIIDFIVKVVDPSKTDTILDPACGTAGFLISAYKHIREKGLTAEEQKKLTDNFVGYDISHDMQRLAMVNMYLHHFPDPKIFEYDTLSSEDRWDDDFDVILANPPFMTPTGGIRPHSKFSVKSKQAEVLFTAYIAEHITTKGRAGIIVPDGIITRSGTAYSSLRKQLIEAGLWCVVDLPAGIFQPYSKVKTSIVFLDKNINLNEVVFAKITPKGKLASYEVSTSTPLNIDEILEDLNIYKLTKKTTSNQIKILPKSKISDSKQAFLKDEYFKDIQSFEKWGMVPLSDILEKTSEKVGNKKDVPVMSITMKDGLVDQSEKFKKRIANIDTSKYKLVKKNELVVGFPIDEGVLGFQKKYDYAAVSPAYDIWKLKRNDIPIEYLESVLRSKTAISIYKKSMKGTANRRRVVPKEIFLSITIPIPSEEYVKKISKEILDIENSNIDLKTKISENDKKLQKLVEDIWK